jgi:cytoskeletal protein RodZ
MKKVKSFFNRARKSTKLKMFVLLIVVFSLGLTTGVIATNQRNVKPTTTTASRKSDTNDRQSESSSEDRNKVRTERVDEAYKKAKARIKEDTQSKVISTEKSETIDKKLDEIYQFVKSVYSGDKTQDELREKRREWRKWMRDNSVSIKYFIGIL